MPRFFAEDINENDICLTGSDARHIGFSLRMRAGEEVTVCCRGVDYNCTIRSITGDCVFLDLVDKHRCAAEPEIEVTLFQAVPKLDKLEYIIQKSVELGVSRIVPVLTRRCISRPDSKDFTKKLPRLNKIAALTHELDIPPVKIGAGIAFCSKAFFKGGNACQTVGQLHQTDRGIAEPSAQSRDYTPVGAERVAVIVLPEDTLGNQSAQVGCDIGHTTQLTDEPTAEALHQDNENVRTRSGEKWSPLHLSPRGDCVLRNWIEFPEDRLAFLLDKVVELGIKVLILGNRRKKAEDWIHS